MDNIYRSCAGIDIHQNNVVACVLVGPLTSTRPKNYQATFKTTTRDLEALNHWFKSFGVEAVSMESTGVYWKPIWHALINDFKLILANPQRIKNIPGQKADKKDAYWIAKLTRIDLIPASFVPDENIQALRSLTRQRIPVNTVFCTS
ncbi:transposase [Staphylococcus pseudintermedius]|nr:transposase [Staphylococcus pseudintermedius]